MIDIGEFRDLQIDRQVNRSRRHGRFIMLTDFAIGPVELDALR
jgi:hypothetical protein